MKTAHEVAGRYGLRKIARGWRGNCPACGYPGALSVLAGREGQAIVACFGGCDQRRPDLPDIAAPLVRPERARTVDKAEAARLAWNGRLPLTGTIGAKYFDRRGIGHLTTSPAFGFGGLMSHPSGGRRAAIIALAQAMDGLPIAIHRSYLGPDGTVPTDLTPRKASLGPIWGGAIRLQAHRPDRPLVIGEGIETSASAGLLIGAPAWAAISAGNLAKGMVLPPEVQDIIVAVDPDPPGERAAHEAAARWMAEGRRVRLARSPGDGDFNDALLARGAA